MKRLLKLSGLVVLVTVINMVSLLVLIGPIMSKWHVKRTNDLERVDHDPSRERCPADPGARVSVRLYGWASVDTGRRPGR